MLNLKEVSMKKLHVFALGLFVSVLFSLTGCELLFMQAAMDFNLSLEPSQTTISPGSSRDITIKVSRILPLNVAPMPITVTLYNSPDGMSLKDGQVEIPNGIDERILTIEVSEDANLGNHQLIIEGSTGLKTKQASLKLIVQ
jgi:uncharacterized membrane protein